jgi:hypothetical protein
VTLLWLWHENGTTMRYSAQGGGWGVRCSIPVRTARLGKSGGLHRASLLTSGLVTLGLAFRLPWWRQPRPRRYDSLRDPAQPMCWKCICPRTGQALPCVVA